jgi:signal transduction histidine kinase/response regulator RpfG family c-di-GMP phosphodiesterase
MYAGWVFHLYLLIIRNFLGKRKGAGAAALTRIGVSYTVIHGQQNRRKIIITIRKLFGSLYTTFFTLFVVLALIAAVSVGLAMYKLFSAYITGAYEETLTRTARLVENNGAAIFSNARAIQAMKENPDERYWELAGRLASTVESYGLASVYILTQEPDGRWRFFVTDACTPENPTGGEATLIYEAPPAGFETAFAEKDFIISKPYTDKWGSFVSAYLPVIKDGEVVSVIGLDYDMNAINDERQQAIRSLVKALLLALGIAVIDSVAVAILFIKPITRGNAAIKRIAENDFSKDVEITGTGELGEMMRNLAKTQEHLKTLIGGLEADNGELVENLIRAKEEAEKANGSKSDFLARMSHEIRSPMNTIIGMSELMRTDNLDDVQQGYFRDIRAMSRSLLGTINDILDFSKIEAGKFELTPVNFSLWAVFDHLSSMNGFLARSKELEFRAARAPDVCEVIFADEIRIRQILSNLLSNAVKYTKKGFVEFSLSAAEREGRPFIVVTVRDSGLGIREENMPHLFDPFAQFDTHKNRGIVGTGLGLPIVKQILDLMGGSIEVKSVYEEGSAFTVYIPYAAGDASKIAFAAQGLPFVTAASAETLSILIVDDLDVNLSVARGFLATHKMNAAVADSGAEAIQKVKDTRFDIIFMDHMMPDMDGIETTQRIRALTENDASFTLPAPDYYTALPIIALTANAVVGAREFFLGNGMNGFISKPIVSEQLNDVLFEFLPHDKLILDEKGATEKNTPGPVTTALSELATIPGMDIEAGLKNNNNDPAMYVRTVQSTYKAVPKERAKLEDDYNKKDWKNFSIRAHALKGIFATIGHKALSETGKELEFAAKEGRIEVCENKTASFIAAMNDFIASLSPLQNMIGAHDAAPRDVEKVSASTSLVKEKIAALISACETSKARLIKSALSELTQIYEHQDIGKILDLIEDYDYDEATKLLHSLEEKV